MGKAIGVWLNPRGLSSLAMAQGVNPPGLSCLAIGQAKSLRPLSLHVPRCQTLCLGWKDHLVMRSICLPCKLRRRRPKGPRRTAAAAAAAAYVLQKLGNCRGGCLVLAVSTAIVWAAASIEVWQQLRYSKGGVGSCGNSQQQPAADSSCHEHSKNRIFFVPGHVLLPLLPLLWIRGSACR